MWHETQVLIASFTV